MDHNHYTNDPMERVSERVVSRSTLLVTCCGKHVGKNAGGVPRTPTVSSNLRRDRKQEDPQLNTKIILYKRAIINIACPIYPLSPPNMQRAMTPIGPIASTPTSTAPLLDNPVTSGVRRTHGTERPRLSAGSGPHEEILISRGGKPKEPSNIYRNRSPQHKMSL